MTLRENSRILVKYNSNESGSSHTSITGSGDELINNARLKVHYLFFFLHLHIKYFS